MLYKQNIAPFLSDGLFKNPTSEYRGTPFWAWNSDLKLDELKRQIEIFKEMGLGGFHMHVRTGMSTPYLSDEFMDLVKGCVEKAKEEKMLAWLYDEDRWPSGAAGGLVTKDEKYRGRCLLMTTVPCSNSSSEADEIDSRAEGGRNGKGYLLTCFDIVLDSDGYLSSYRKISESEEACGTKWYAYLKIHGNSSWYNNQSYVDTLNPDAIKKFIEVTHERYKEVVGDDFDNTVPAIFTDEPQFTRKHILSNSTDTSDIIMPWTDDLSETFKKQYNYDIIDFLPEIFWEKEKGEVSLARYHYHDHIAERFACAFADSCGKWCKENNIALTGHMMEEPTLQSQTAALGETMRSYRGFGLPGIDMLCANFEFTTAKQAQSAVHQFGREGMLSELYGVTGWDYDFRGYKLHGDWQACLGVTIRVPHLSWVSMNGEAKRDYPASISYQSPWYSEFSCLEDHFARINTAMTRGKPIVKVGVIHPIESFWLYWGPNDKTALRRDNLNKKFLDLTEWLLKGSIDFDFISESLLPDLCENACAPLKVGCSEYDAIVVPDCITLRSSTLERLVAFVKSGGKLIFMGECPKYIDGKPDDAVQSVYNDSTVIPFDRTSILTALEEFRSLTLRKTNGFLTDDLIYQLREDNDCRWLFISHCKEPCNKDKIDKNNVCITVNGEYIPVLYDTSNGDIFDLPCEYIGGKTVISRTLYSYDSLLIKLIEGKRTSKVDNIVCSPIENEVTLPVRLNYTLSEPNVLLLDTAEYKIDDGDYMPEEEILRLDNICRKLLGFKERGGNVAQPWVIKQESPTHTITLRFTIESTIDFSGAQLALENAEKSIITLNGQPVASKIIGYYVDKDINTIALPDIIKGENILEITLPIGNRTDTEWCYIIGSFGVNVNGREKKIVPLPEKLTFGSLTKSSLAFYGGNITYHTKIKGSRISVQASKYRGALVTVSVDGERKGRIIYPPYTLCIENLEDKLHDVDITLFGNRFNAFGPVHNADEKESWQGPGAWRSENELWSSEYILKDVGFLKAPVIKAK